MSALRSKTGILNYHNGSAQPARFYYNNDEDEPQSHTQIDSEHHAAWIEDDGAVGIRTRPAVSVGATPAYSSRYDAVDWGN
jgi:hypothetical protein